MDNRRKQVMDLTRWSLVARSSVCMLRDSSLEKFQVCHWELLALIDECQSLSLRTEELPSLPHQSALAESRF